MRKVFGVSAVLATIATVAFTASMAMAVPATTLLHNPEAQFELNCDTTPGTTGISCIRSQGRHLGRSM